MIPRYKRNKKYNKTKGIFRKDYPWRKRQVIKGDKEEYLFLHIHKTGGTSIKDFLIGKNLKKASHARSSDIIEEIGYDAYKKFKTFAVVRNPYDRVISAYYYMSTTERMPPTVTLKEFVMDKESKYSMYNEVCATPQYQYLEYKGKIECDTLIRFEDLENDFCKFVEDTGIIKREEIKKFPHNLKTKRKGYMTYFEGKKNMIESINEYYDKDFDIFGYEKLQL
jgi:Sulfotransferase family